MKNWHEDRNIDYEIKDKKQQKKNLALNLLELILMQKIIFLLKFTKCTITLLNKIKNQLKIITRQDFKKNIKIRI